MGIVACECPSQYGFLAKRILSVMCASSETIILSSACAAPDCMHAAVHDLRTEVRIARRRLVYDDKGHFQSYDTVDGEEGVVDNYDYDESEPAGCQRGLEAGFVLGGIPSSTAWADIPVNKAAFWVDPAAAALYSGNTIRDGETGAGATSMQPILCRAVPARISVSDGGVFGVFPIASIALAAFIVFMALLSLLLLCCSACLRKETSSTQKGYHSAISLTTR